eukprot:SAG25_NODE_11199_length_311_cov_0.523585_1_plen_46_part_10
MAERCPPVGARAQGMRVMTSGDDGLEGMLDELDDCRVMFGYVRCIM